MDRAAATEALNEFVGPTEFTGNQLAFVNLIIEQLTQRGSVPTRLLYEAPFTDYAPKGPDELFTDTQMSKLVDVLRQVSSTAAAS
jgi:type I restriction enzyme R subunit